MGAPDGLGLHLEGFPPPFDALIAQPRRQALQDDLRIEHAAQPVHGGLLGFEPRPFLRHAAPPEAIRPEAHVAHRAPTLHCMPVSMLLHQQLARFVEQRPRKLDGPFCPQAPGPNRHGHEALVRAVVDTETATGVHRSAGTSPHRMGIVEGHLGPGPDQVRGREAAHDAPTHDRHAADTGGRPLSEKMRMAGHDEARCWRLAGTLVSSAPRKSAMARMPWRSLPSRASASAL